MLIRTLALLAPLVAFGCAPLNDTDVPVDSDTDVEPVVQGDADGDTILDVHEGSEDADDDGKPNMDDLDSDGDTIRDKVEAGDRILETLPIDSDRDGVPDFLDLDSDNNCLGDEDEAGRGGAGGAIDTDGDGVKDFADPDNDGDGLLDVDEIGDGVACNPLDTDGDGTPDYMDLDSDNDRIGDRWEAGNSEFDSTPADTDGDGIPDFRDSDSDNDGLSDTEEAGVDGVGTEPRDTDGDGTYDFADSDSDGDGISDKDEIDVYDTDPYDPDTDGDGFADGGEVLAGTDPLDAESIIRGLYVEITERSEKELTFDFELRIQRGDVAFLVDTTCSMSGTVAAVRSQYNEIVDALADTFEDVAFGYATFDDYPFGSMGSPSVDSAFWLRQQITTDKSVMDSALSKQSIHAGADGQESTMEALYQAASGAGYDMNCDGRYAALSGGADPVSNDILPFLSSSGDPFGGSAGEQWDPSTPGGGKRGGFGFRDYSLAVIVYATDMYIRDADSSNPTLATTPGGCPFDAGHTDMIAALDDLGGYIIGADVGGQPITSVYSPYTQMIDFAQQTNSVADLDGDGEADEELVFKLSQSTLGFDKEFTDAVVTAVDQLVAAIDFEEVGLKVDGDEYGFVVDIDPESYVGIDPEVESELQFTLTFRGTVAATTEDQLFLLTLNVLGDNTTLLDSLDIVVLVKGTSYD